MKNLKAVIDLETTGFSNSDKIVEVAFLIFDENFTVISSFQSLFNPRVPMPEKARSIHGITDEMVEFSPCFEQIAGFVHSTSMNIESWIAHNANFDKRMLENNLLSCGVRISSDWICTQSMTKENNVLESYSLPNVCKHFEIPLNNHHRAMNDVIATFELYKKLINQ